MEPGIQQNFVLIMILKHPSAHFSFVVNSQTQTALESSASDDAISTRGGGLSVLKSLDIPLILYFIFWYVGNYYVSASM